MGSLFCVMGCGSWVMGFCSGLSIVGAGFGLGGRYFPSGFGIQDSGSSIIDRPPTRAVWSPLSFHHQAVAAAVLWSAGLSAPLTVNGFPHTDVLRVMHEPSCGTAFFMFKTRGQGRLAEWVFLHNFAPSKSTSSGICTQVVQSQFFIESAKDRGRGISEAKQHKYNPFSHGRFEISTEFRYRGAHRRG